MQSLRLAIRLAFRGTIKAWRRVSVRIRAGLAKRCDRSRAYVIRDLDAIIDADKRIIVSLREELIELEFRHARSISRTKADIAVESQRQARAEKGK